MTVAILAAPKLPDFQKLTRDSLRNDRKIDSTEAKTLTDAATQRIGGAINPVATFEKYSKELTALATKAKDSAAREKLLGFSGEDGFKAMTDRATVLSNRAVTELTSFLQANKGKLKTPLNMIVTEPVELKDLDGREAQGGLFASDEDNNTSYVSVPLDVSGKKDSEINYRRLSDALKKAIAAEPKLTHLRGVSFLPLLVRPS
jgi:hypothetical protein